MALTASNNMARVSGTGDLKYSSKASNSKGYEGGMASVCGINESQDGRATNLVNVQERMACANSHGFYNGSSGHGRVKFAIDQVENVDKGRAFTTLGFALCRVGVAIVILAA